MESEPIVTRIADSTQQVCLRNESQTGNNSDKSSGEESTNEHNKAGNDDECQKSQGWKGFSLKRQLSKVDLKIKNTFTPSLVSSQNGVLVCFLIRALIIFLYVINKSHSNFKFFCVVTATGLYFRGIFKLHDILIVRTQVSL